MSAREEIATAATLPDVTNVTPYYRQSMRAGDGFVRMAGRRVDTTRLGRIDTWEVWLAIPQDLADGEKWVDTHLDAIMASVSTAMYLTEATPRELILTDAKINGIIITGTLPH